MSSDGKRLDGCEQKHKGYIVADNAPKLRKKQLLLTDKDFDRSEAFSVSSPIKIIKYSPKNKCVEYVFLYDHDQNKELTENGMFATYLPYDTNHVFFNARSVK